VVGGKGIWLVAGDADLLDMGSYAGVEIVAPRHFLNVLKQVEEASEDAKDAEEPEAPKEREDSFDGWRMRLFAKWGQSVFVHWR
jgi:hypothetical protein